MQFPKSSKNQVSRLAKRATLEAESIYAILDEALFCTLSFTEKNESFQIPTGMVRMGNEIMIHGSVGSHFLRTISDGRALCVTATILDAIVLAKSAFHHSVNYRSVVFFSKAILITDPQEAEQVMAAFTNKMFPGRWDEVRKPNASEWKKTMMLKLPIEEASAKVRTGPPVDDEEDLSLAVKTGIVPLKKGFENPQWL